MVYAEKLMSFLHKFPVILTYQFFILFYSILPLTVINFYEMSNEKKQKSNTHSTFHFLNADFTVKSSFQVGYLPSNFD